MLIEAKVRSKAFKRGNEWEKSVLKSKPEGKLGLHEFVGHLSLDVTNKADAVLLRALWRHCFGPLDIHGKGSIKVFDEHGECVVAYGYVDNRTMNEEPLPTEEAVEQSAGGSR